MVTDKQIAEKVKELRKSRGLDVDSFGKLVSRSGKTVSAWETGRNAPSAEMLINICRAFDVEIGYFYPDDVTATPAHKTFNTADEEELLGIYRSMSPKGKEQLMVFARGCAATYPKNSEAVAS